MIERLCVKTLAGDTPAWCKDRRQLAAERSCGGWDPKPLPATQTVQRAVPQLHAPCDRVAQHGREVMHINTRSVRQLCTPCSQHGPTSIMTRYGTNGEDGPEQTAVLGGLGTQAQHHRTHQQRTSLFPPSFTFCAITRKPAHLVGHAHGQCRELSTPTSTPCKAKDTLRACLRGFHRSNVQRWDMGRTVLFGVSMRVCEGCVCVCMREGELPPSFITFRLDC